MARGVRSCPLTNLLPEDKEALNALRKATTTRAAWPPMRLDREGDRSLKPPVCRGRPEGCFHPRLAGWLIDAWEVNPATS